jgi:hypothetical protein
VKFVVAVQRFVKRCRGGEYPCRNRRRLNSPRKPAVCALLQMPVKNHRYAAHEQPATRRYLDLAIIDVDQTVVDQRREIVQFILKIGFEIDAMRTFEVTDMQTVMTHELLNNVSSNAIVLIDFNAAIDRQSAA